MRVIRQEAEALRALADTLNITFERAVDCILSAPRRVVVCALGKSGHVGRKVSATLAASGTPSFFIHASEASHGDLGMLIAGDVLMLFSNSGETPELKPVIERAIALAIPVIAIASKADSFLMRKADYPLLLPDMPEACPNAIAPTTSTTMMMALGDALAVAIMEQRGVSRKKMAALHPGGAIGHRLMSLEALLGDNNDLPLVLPHTSMRDAVLEMTSTGKGAVCVVDDEGNLAGIITDGDVRRAIDRIHTATCSDIMNADPLTIAPDTAIEDAYQLMSAHRVNVLIVLDRVVARKPLGIIHIHDLTLLT
ncbi:MAG: KpsF/GutQ family sugar-phosphate isomerase [Sphingobium sp.]